ncbi:hypothetical protein BDR05DRAFT_970771, partial [Suillus weaverae]
MPQSAGRSCAECVSCHVLSLGTYSKGQAPTSAEATLPDQHGRHALDTGPRTISHGPHRGF